MLVRTAKTFLTYFTLSITKTSVILRYVGHACPSAVPYKTHISSTDIAS